MSDSILECSGGHWVRAGLTWTCIAIAVVVNLPRGEAEERAGRAQRMAKAEASVAIQAVETAWETQTAVTHRVTPFDFNAADMKAYGDAESAEPPQR